MQYIKVVLVILISLITYSCFSAKGLPIKEVAKDNSKQVSDVDSMTADSTKLSSEIKDDVQTDYVTMTPMVDHSEWDKLLKKYVAENGDVNYQGFKNDREALDNYINYLATKVPAKDWSVQEQLAYFINVYNANTIQLIIDNYPTKSIKDISNPWLKNRLKIGDEDYSLADIENGILRKMNEPRIHFAINCASVSCPKLLNTAYTANNVEALMEKATADFINNNDKNQLAQNQLQLSKIFKWYESDFTSQGSLVDYINQYANIDISKDAKIDYIEYNWALNEQNR
ncbi:MAG: DUF547 domain-containing protein [Algicola sp.]|nr:DUF547 domain-containing protein [Algicola sp.]